MSVESFIPSRKLSQSIRIGQPAFLDVDKLLKYSLAQPEIPLKPRNPSASPLKRARSSNDTDEEAVGKSFKKNKVESASKEAGTDHFVAEPKTFPSKTAKLISISTPASLSTNAQHSSVGEL